MSWRYSSSSILARAGSSTARACSGVVTSIRWVVTGCSTSIAIESHRRTDRKRDQVKKFYRMVKNIAMVAVPRRGYRRGITRGVKCRRLLDIRHTREIVGRDAKTREESFDRYHEFDSKRGSVRPNPPSGPLSVPVLRGMRHAACQRRGKFELKTVGTPCGVPREMRTVAAPTAQSPCGGVRQSGAPGLTAFPRV